MTNTDSRPPFGRREERVPLNFIRWVLTLLSSSSSVLLFQIAAKEELRDGFGSIWSEDPGDSDLGTVGCLVCGGDGDRVEGVPGVPGVAVGGGGGKGNDPERLGLGEPELQSCATNKYVLPLTWFSMEHCRKRPFWTVLFGNVRDLTHRKVQVALIFDCWRDGKIKKEGKIGRYQTKSASL